jgi:hypothetical protein
VRKEFENGPPHGKEPLKESGMPEKHAGEIFFPCCGLPAQPPSSPKLKTGKNGLTQKAVPWNSPGKDKWKGWMPPPGR